MNESFENFPSSFFLLCSISDLLSPDIMTKLLKSDRAPDSSVLDHGDDVLRWIPVIR